jgi:hypothetical protein
MNRIIDKRLKRGIADVRRGIKNLRLLGLKIELDEVENMMGHDVTNIYVIDSYMILECVQRVSLQKHLFTV